jgi:DNA (cytosine-5)-methyltransferase 1
VNATVGSLCSGYGGLEMGLALALGGDVRTAWHVEYAQHPSAVLAHRYPSVPNYGDVKTVDWSSIEPIDWLTAGFPCQPASQAGKRQGVNDERWLWDDVARAVEGLHPRSVLLENVPGLLTVGGGRAFERVVCDLAALGYVGRYGVVRAADAGAAHGRARVFVVAELAPDAGRGGEQRQRGPGELARTSRPGEGDGREWERLRDAARDGRATPADADGDGRPWVSRAPAGRVEVHRNERRDADGRRSAADADGARRGRARRAVTGVGHDPGRAARWPAAGRDDRAPSWGVYEPAIRRWEAVLGRPAPRPTEPAPRAGRERLSPRFVEWLMGLPEGWVTDVPGLPRNAMLKALGNGVVPQQAALACRLLGITPQQAAA